MRSATSKAAKQSQADKLCLRLLRLRVLTLLLCARTLLLWVWFACLRLFRPAISIYLRTILSSSSTTTLLFLLSRTLLSHLHLHLHLASGPASRFSANLFSHTLSLTGNITTARTAERR